MNAEQERYTECEGTLLTAQWYGLGRSLSGTLAGDL